MVYIFYYTHRVIRKRFLYTKMCVWRPETAILRFSACMGHISVSTCCKGPEGVAKRYIHPVEAVAGVFAVKYGFLCAAFFLRLFRPAHAIKFKC